MAATDVYRCSKIMSGLKCSMKMSVNKITDFDDAFAYSSLRSRKGIHMHHPLRLRFATVIAVLTALVVISFASCGGDTSPNDDSRAQLDCDSLQAVEPDTNGGSPSQTGEAEGEDSSVERRVHGIEIDRNALVALYHATGGESWHDSTNWLTDKPLSEWDGVKTDSTGRVVELFLFRNRLSGELPAELGNLAYLELLAIWGTTLDGVRGGVIGKIPAELGCLTNLRILSLRESRLTGEIPPALGNLVNQSKD